MGDSIVREHSKSELQTSMVPRGTSTIPLGHDGRAQGTPRGVVLHTPAGESDAFKGHVHSDLARNGAPKQHHAVVRHSNMRSRTSPLPGMLHQTDVNGYPDAVQPHPQDLLTSSQRGKELFGTGVKIHPGMTSKQVAGFANAHVNGGGAPDVLAEALSFSDPHHPARGRL
jgi:hypothetical protein